MSWSAPKLDWDTPDGVSTTDLNRIEKNILYLREHVCDLGDNFVMPEMPERARFVFIMPNFPAKFEEVQ